MIFFFPLAGFLLWFFIPSSFWMVGLTGGTLSWVNCRDAGKSTSVSFSMDLTNSCAELWNMLHGSKPKRLLPN